MGKFAEAAEGFSEVRRRVPRQYEAVRGLIDCYYQTNRPEQALADLDEGRKLFPNDPAIREMYLNHLVNYGNPAEAIKDRVKLRDEHPEEPGYHLALASTYFHAAQHVAPTNGKAASELLNEAYQTLVKATAVPRRRAVLRPTGGDAQLRRQGRRRGEAAGRLRPPRLDAGQAAPVAPARRLLAPPQPARAGRRRAGQGPGQGRPRRGGGGAAEAGRGAGPAPAVRQGHGHAGRDEPPRRPPGRPPEDRDPDRFGQPRRGQGRHAQGAGRAGRGRPAEPAGQHPDRHRPRHRRHQGAGPRRSNWSRATRSPGTSTPWRWPSCPGRTWTGRSRSSSSSATATRETPRCGCCWRTSTGTPASGTTPSAS